MILLIKGADLFVDEAARIARLLGISGFVIGLTLVSIGTSLPELATSILASFYKQSTIVIGNIIGSNIANIGLVLGIATVMTTIILKKNEYLKDSLLLMGLFIFFFILALDKTISFSEGIILLLLFLVYLYRLLKRKPIRGEETLKKFLKEYIHPVNGKLNLKNYEQAIDQGVNYRIYGYLLRHGVDVKGDFKSKLLWDVYKKLFYCTIGLTAIFFGAKYLVTSAIDIALFFTISPTIIGITAIAIGTSLPELFVTITSAKKGLSSILIGNLIGSGITNILLVGGIAAIITPLTLTTADIFFYLPIMLFMGLAFIQFVRSKWISKVFQGILLLLFYTTFLFFTIVFQVL
tara:strand:- start:3375 stop:4421 length:1047 start_codon:yes stop_codon:yes gene_type:complete